MEFDDIERILELVKQHDLAEFELERDGLKLRDPQGGAERSRLRHRRLRCRRSTAAARRRRRLAASPPAVRCAETRTPRIAGRARRGEVADRRHVLSLAGARRRRRSSKSAQRVKKDQVLCIIEAMKLMNEITSEYDGEIVSAYVENGKPVQYGERLFAIKTVTSPDDTMFKKILIANRGEIALRDHLRLPRAGHQAPWRCTRRRTRTRCTCALPTRTSASARRAAPTAT